MSIGVKDKGFLKDGPMISVIVPVYNTANYVERCIESILNQTYQNMEIILVDDGSTDGSVQILEKYAQNVSGIRLLKHEKNQGVFQARLTGVKAARGEYIAFVDSDDYVSIDWFRMLIMCAEENDCDMVAGDFCFDYGKGDVKVPNLDPLCIREWNLTGDAVLDEFMRQHGQAFSWYVVWNKIYSRRLWEEKYDELEAYSKAHGHMLMWDDVAFSSAMWTSAQHFMNVHGVLYYYVKANSESATSSISVRRDIGQKNKYIADVRGALDFQKKQLEGIYVNEERKRRLLEMHDKWRQNAAAILYDDLDGENSRSIDDKIESLYEQTAGFKRNDGFFHHILTPVSSQFSEWEKCLKRIKDSRTKIVSFDVFDTLVKRNVLFPTDVFEILSNEMNKRFQLACVDFSAIRRAAEKRCREVICVMNPAFEDITLAEIYEQIRKECAIDEEILAWAINREKELELEFCTARNTGRILFDLAKQAGKRIVICSDMYLSKDTIESILHKNGFDGYEDIFVSSECRVGKWTGGLYAAAQKKLAIQNAAVIVHIGDNKCSDIEQAQKAGWQACFVMKAEDLMFNRNQDAYTGEAMNRVIWRNPQYIDMKVHSQFLSLRCIMGLMAAKCYDQPYIHMHPQSDYNAEPGRIGYMVLGPHLLALCKWMEKIAIQEQIPTIHFVARDGYLLKQAFEVLNTHSQIKTNYIRLSRKTLILADIKKPEDLYSIITKANIQDMTAEKLANYLDPIIPEDKKSGVFKLLDTKGILKDKPFRGVELFNQAMKVFIEEIIDIDLLEAYQNKMRAYFAQLVKPGDYLFDVGYSGRPESALSSLLGYPIGSLYIHTNNDVAMKRQKMHGSKCFCFYQHKPTITGLLREHLLMELGPSTIGYAQKDGVFQPVFEEYEEDYATTLITKTVQDAAMRFVMDYQRAFGKYGDMMDIRPDDASAWLEDYIHTGKKIDGELFACVHFEDDFGMGKDVNLVDVWRYEREQCCPIAAQGEKESVLADMYVDGYFVKLYKVINRLFPKGGKAREMIKRAAGLFIR